MVPPSPFLVVSRILRSRFSRVLFKQHLIVHAEFRKTWMLFFFCRSGHPVVTPDHFLDSVGHLLP